MLNVLKIGFSPDFRWFPVSEHVSNDSKFIFYESAQNFMPKSGRFPVKKPTSGLEVMTGSQKVALAKAQVELSTLPKFHSNRIIGLGGHKMKRI